ncbi:SusD/RagB family nutrient-binding outer membrane lipoprotein [Flavobacterium acetivorans]|uniref:SusD/RagB family nutrient-binding outer membrane lipoprotein n=1 Tax=Flavobacterium acetivorans TaxID=2893883 RepID=UPI001E5EAD4B|nr:SusD/RagB family nutrient-binding outer membrane lipoprotein [Flavobacterium sp. F-29]UFH34302.1 SusD/RagB family nutrient-binding outer membrane lipoprotein [Flavobacterium sp. F-29]
MKNIVKKSGLVLAMIATLASCDNFEEINIDPTAANAEQVQVEYFINSSIIGAQMNPDVAERSFVLYWKTAGHQMLSTGISGGSYDDGWSTAYYNSSAGWLNSINTAIQIADEKEAKGIVKPYSGNLKQIARIWRAYLMSELADNFGPIAIEAFQAKNPEFNNVKDVYYFMLAELKDASEKIDISVSNSSNDKLKEKDPAYGYDYVKWRKYANSMRLRLAMRLSEVDPAKAKSEFEAAANGNLITDAGDNFQVQEKPGWDDLTGVMSREWNAQIMSVTLNNLYIGLGGIKSTDQLAPSFHASVKPADYIGQKFADHFTMKTNEPAAGYWLDGLPNRIDPRAYKTFNIPGDFNSPIFSGYPSWDNSAETTTADLLDNNGAVIKTIEAKNTWNAFAVGNWGAMGSKNQVRAFNGTMPRLSQVFRGSGSQRIFFASWETYFLLAEAAVKGWAVPMSGKEAYEEGIKANFAYWGVSSHLSTYLASEDYNRAGTSVSWNHTTEPAASHTMNFVDGYTNTPGVATILYPKNDLYKNGAVKNDLLTKIITQKFIAQTPWLPLEGWNDHRRLGLPFFENPAVELPLPNLPALTQSNYMGNQVSFFPQRLRYISGLKNSNPKGYTQAVEFLGGDDSVFTPLWWAKH